MSKTPTERIGRWDRFKEISNERHVSEDHRFWDNVYYVTKIGFSVFLFLCILSSAVISKGALLLLTWNLYTPHNTIGNKLKTLDGHLNYTANETRRQTVADSGTNVYYIWALFLMIVTPYFLTALLCLQRILFKGKRKFRLVPLLLMLITSSIHTVGFSIFVFSLLPTLDPFSGLLYCSSITFFPATLQAVFYSARTGTKKRICFVLNLVSVFLVVISIILWTVYAGVGSNPSLAGDKIALFFICPFLISFGWSENFLPPSEPSNDTCTDNKERETRPEGEDKSSEKESQKLNIITERLRVIGQEIQESGYIIFLIVNIWKILWTFFMVLIIFGSSCDEGSKCVDILLDRENKDVIAHLSSKAFGTTWLYHGRKCELGTAFIIAVVGLFSSFFCQRLCVGAIKIVAQFAIFYLPIVLTTPVTFGVAAVIIGTLSDNAMCTFPFPWWDGNRDIRHWLLIFFAGLTGYISLIFTTTFLWNNSVSRMERLHKLFSQPLYCGALFDQSMLLNRKRDYKPDDENEDDSDNESNTNLYDQGPSNVKPIEVPLLYLCATMWHENETEMTQILTSLFRMDIDQCVRSLTHAGDGDYYKFEAHIFFDDAFQSGTSVVGEYVETFKQVIEKTASYFYPKKFSLDPPKMYSTPYGGRFVYQLPGENLMYVHLKDKTKIRNKKRWSQVMYMYYFLSHKIDNAEEDPKETEQRAKNTFILALDGDVDFRPTAVKLLVDRMKRNPLVGAACGRIHPIGDGPMVWYQKFEYAVSHWLIKSTEHVTGCVLCSPGCFSLFRGSSLMQCNVMKKYTSMPTNGTQHIQYDQGEDRWLCTLLLKQGMKIDYCAASDAYTFAPEGFKEFYKQRRRWSPSTMANVIDILSDWRNVTKKNTNMSMLYIMLQTAWFFSGVLTPGVLFLMIVGAINLAYPALSLHASLLINLGPIVLFVIVCFFAEEKHQLNFAAALSVVYSLVMMIVLVGLIKQSVDEGLCSITPIFSIFVAGVFVIAGLSHPKEFRCLLHGPLFFIAIPSMSMLLMLYSIINLNNVSWGTREVRKPEDKGKENKGAAESTARSLLDKLRLSCKCCTETKSSTRNEDDLAQKLDEITLRLKSIEENIQPNDHEVVRSAATTPFSAVKTLPASPRPEAWAVSPSALPKSALQVDRKKTPEGTNFEAGAKLDSDEQAFWEWLIKTYLYPLNAKREETLATGEPVKVEEKVDVPKELRVLRNKATLAFLLLNSLFITVIFFLQLANKDTAGQIAIKISCSNGKTLLVEPISVAFTIVFGVLLAIQFICMLLHRWKTFLQINSITPFRREINIEQLLMDAFEDIFEYQREKEAKKYKLTSSFQKTVTKHTFKSWLIKALKHMQVRVNKEEEERTQPKGMKGIIAQHTQRLSFKNKVKTVRTLEKTLKVMKTEQVKNLKDCLMTAMKSLRENRESQEKTGLGSVVDLVMGKNQSNTKQGKVNSTTDVVVEQRQTNMHERRSKSRRSRSLEEKVAEREKNDITREVDNETRPTTSGSKLSKSRIEQGPEEKETKVELKDSKRIFEKSVRPTSRISSRSKSKASSRRSSTVEPTDELDVTDLSE